MRRPPFAQYGIIALMLTIVPVGKTLAETDRRPHVLVLVADDLRADVLSAYGGPVPTPHLDRLAARGCLFRRASCGYPICHVSRTEMLSGRSVVREAASGGSIPFPSEWVLWPQAMAQAGWHTVHSGKWHVQGTPTERGYAETVGLYSAGGSGGKGVTHPLSATGRPVSGYVGWTFKDAQNRALPEQGIGLTPQTDTLIADAAVSVIQKGMKQPLFLHVNFTAPHDPLHWPEGTPPTASAESIKLPPNFATQHPFEHGNLQGRDERIVPAPRTADDVRRERAVYYAVVAQLDAQIGRILAAIAAPEQQTPWLVIFTSDQGLALGSHGLMGKQNQYEHTVNSPLILAGPGIPAGKAVDAQCALRDLFPTTCELLGVPVPASVQGQSLLPLVRGERAMLHPEIYGYFTTTQRMVRTEEGWKLIWYPAANREQLFHLPTDPHELRDRSGESDQQPRLARLRKMLRENL